MVETYSSISTKEDILLQRVFEGINDGFYIDVGAFKPDHCSNTYALYRRGWHGIVVDPLIGLAPWLEQLWREMRPRDYIVGTMAAATPGQMPFWVCCRIDEPGVLNLAAQVSTGLPKKFTKLDIIGDPVMVQAFTLNEMLSLVDHEPQLLCIDVEGMEEEVLSGLDLAKHRPWVMVVEIRRPNQFEPADSFEPRLFSNDYRMVYDDGWNRFYLADEHVELTKYFYYEPHV